MRTLVQSPAALGRAVRDARRDQHLTQVELAKRAGIAQPTVSNVERGASSVSIETLLRILAVLKLELLLQTRQPVDIAAHWQDEE